MANTSAIKRKIDEKFDELLGTLPSGDLPADSTGNIWFVDSVNGNNSNNGQRASKAFATLARALSFAVAKDTIILLEAHSETLTAATTLSQAGLRLIGQGVGIRRPSFTANFAGDTFNITGASVLIENILFNEATSVSGGAINVGAVDCFIRNCQFDLGANDLEAITIPAAGDNCIIEGCFFNVTANGPDAAIEIEAAGVDSFIARRNEFKCSNGTDAFDVAAINAGALATTNLRVYENTFEGNGVVSATLVATGALNPVIHSNTYVTGAVNVDNAEVGTFTTASRVVNRATATLPQGADVALFSIAGGRVILQDIVGEVTTAIGAGGNDTKLKFNPTVAGNDTDLCGVLDIVSDAVGILYSITGVVANALQEGILTVRGMTTPLILSEGDIELDCAGNNTGSVAWTIRYVALDSGASIVAV
jgi:hypothetical protein